MKLVLIWVNVGRDKRSGSRAACIYVQIEQSGPEHAYSLMDEQCFELNYATHVLLINGCMHACAGCWNVPVPYHGTVVLVPIACDVLTLKISSLQAFRIHHPSDLSPSTVADKAMATYISLCFSLSLVKQYQAIGGTNYFFAKCINRKGSFYKFTSLRRGNTHPIQLNPLDLSNNGDHGP
jgi:hypothetical protein